MQSTDEANQAPFPLDASGLTWMQSRVLARNEAKGISRAGITQQRLDIGFQIIEVDVITAVGPALRKPCSPA